MNKQRRAKITKLVDEAEKFSMNDHDTASALKILQEMLSKTEKIQEEEQDCFDNLSEGLQCTARGLAMENAAELLGYAVDSLQYAIDCINEEHEDCVDENLDDYIDSMEEAKDA